MSQKFRRRLRPQLREAAGTARAIVELVSDRNLTLLAAGIAYYAFVSIIPMLLLAVAAASYLGGEALATSVADMLSQQLSDSGREIVTGALTNTTGRATASVIGFVTLSWSALKLFRGLDQAFDEVYLNDLETSLLEQLGNAVVVILGIGLSVALVVAVGVAVSMLSLQIPLLGLFSSVILIGVLTVALLPVYYVLPPVEVSVREVLPGAVFAAVGWVLLQFGFRIYAANAGSAAAYGVLGAVLLFVTWLYFASLIVLLGSVVNAVRRGNRPITS